MANPEAEPKEVEGQSGATYANIKTDDDYLPEHETDAIVPGEPVVGPQGE